MAKPNPIANAIINNPKTTAAITAGGTAAAGLGGHLAARPPSPSPAAAPTPTASQPGWLQQGITGATNAVQNMAGKAQPWLEANWKPLLAGPGALGGAALLYHLLSQPRDEEEKQAKQRFTVEHGLVAGFFEKCAEACLPPSAIEPLVTKAGSLSPTIAAAFTRAVAWQEERRANACPFAKAADGIPGMKDPFALGNDPVVTPNHAGMDAGLNKPLPAVQPPRFAAPLSAEQFQNHFASLPADVQAGHRATAQGLEADPYQAYLSEHAYGELNRDFPGLQSQKLDAPSQQDLLVAFRSMPPEQQQAVLHRQAGEIEGFRDPNSMSHDAYANPLLPMSRIGAGSRPAGWMFPARDNLPADQLHLPEQYHNIPELAQAYGVDVRQRDFRDWWRRQQANWANRAPGQFQDGPAQLVSAYRQDLHNRLNAVNNHNNEQGAFGRRLLGGQRDSAGGRGPETFVPMQPRSMSFLQHLGGALNTLGAARLAPVALATDAASMPFGGDTSSSRMTAREMLRYGNDLFGTDLGHNVPARPIGYGRPGTPSPAVGPDAGRALWSPSRNPVTGDVSLPAIGPNSAVGNTLTEMANTPDSLGGSWLQRTVGRGLQPLNNASQLLAGLSAGGRLAGDVGLGGTPLAGLGNAGMNLARFTVNPLVQGVSSGIRELPPGGDRNVGDTFTDWGNAVRQNTSLDPRSSLPTRMGGEALAGLLKAGPDLVAGGVGGRMLTNRLSNALGLSPNTVMLGAGASGGLPAVQEGSRALTQGAEARQQHLARMQQEAAQETGTSESRQLRRLAEHHMQQAHQQLTTSGRVAPSTLQALQQLRPLVPAVKPFLNDIFGGMSP